MPKQNEKLEGIKDGLRAVLRMLKRPVENEVNDLIREALSKVQAEQNDNAHRWSEGF